jgi:hypothetical protein
VVGSCECSSETLGSIRCGKFDYLRNCWLLKKDSILWLYFVEHMVFNVCFVFLQ